MARAEVEADAPDQPVGLLHADEEHLRLAAATLRRGGRFVLVVAGDALWPATSRFLRELLPGHRFVEHAPTSADQANRAISDPLRDEPGLTIVLRITGSDAGPTETLNLRREDLVRRAANFVVVLDGDVAHSRFLREAPDCYSYRDLLTVVQGEPALGMQEPLGAVPDEIVSAAVISAQQDTDPRRRAELLLYLIQRGYRSDNARRLLDQTIAALTPEQWAPSEWDRLLLAMLYHASALDGSRAERYRRMRKALEILGPVADRLSEQFGFIEGSMPDAIGTDLTAALDGIRRARASGGAIAPLRIAVAHAYWSRDDLVRARAVLDEPGPDKPAGAMVQDLEKIMRLRMLVKAGEWVEANEIVSSWTDPAPALPPVRDQLAVFWATLLMRQGEGRAAIRIVEQRVPAVRNEVMLIRILADAGELTRAAARLEDILHRPWGAFPSGFDDRFEAHQLLVYLTEQGIAAGTPVYSTEELDARLAMLRDQVEQNEEPDPPWEKIHCRLLQADAFLRRHGVERAGLLFAEQARAIAEDSASILVARSVRRGVVALIRLGELADAKCWLARGLAAAREHGLLGEEAHLRGLALWHATLAGEDTRGTEAGMHASFDDSGSRLIEGSVLARIGTALGRRDLLLRAQQIYRSLPWPAREGACLEALGETQIAEARYQAYGLATRLSILRRRSGPPPISADDDIGGNSRP